MVEIMIVDLWSNKYSIMNRKGAIRKKKKRNPLGLSTPGVEPGICANLILSLSRPEGNRPIRFSGTN
jgi:hypothetical protein